MTYEAGAVMFLHTNSSENKEDLRCSIAENHELGMSQMNNYRLCHIFDQLTPPPTGNVDNIATMDAFSQSTQSPIQT